MGDPYSNREDNEGTKREKLRRRFERSAAESAGLVSDIVGRKRFARSLLELRADALSTAASTERRLITEYDQRSLSFLNSTNWDPEKLMNRFKPELYKSNVSATASSTRPDMDEIENTNIEDFLASHHDTILHKAHEQSKASTESNLRELQLDWASTNWIRAREAFGKSRSDGLHRVAAPVTYTSIINGSFVQAQPLKPTVKAHAQIVQDMVRGRKNGKETCISFKKEINSPSLSQDVRMDMRQKGNYEQWMELLTHTVGSNDIRKGEFAMFALDPDTVNGPKPPSARHHFEKLECMKHDILINRYNKLRDVGRLHCGINGQKKLEKRAIVVTYLKALQLDNIISLDQGISSANSIHFGTNVSLWLLVHFCMLSGDFEGALDEMKEARQQHQYIDPVIVLLELENNHRTYPPNVLMRAFDACDQLRLQFEAQNNPEHEHALQVLRLLTRCDEYESEEDSHSIWKELWFYDWGRKLLHNRLTNSQFVNDYVDDFEKYYVDRIIDLQIDEAEKENPNAKNPNEFIDPVIFMLAFHRFSRAVQYLCDTNELFAATHILVICLHYGLIKPFGYLVEDQTQTQFQIQPKKPIDILNMYIQAPEFGFATHPEEMTDYILTMTSGWDNIATPEKRKAQKEADDAFETLFVQSIMSVDIKDGDESKDGLKIAVGRIKMQDGFNTERINIILKKAAHRVRREKNDHNHLMRILMHLPTEDQEDLVNEYCKTLSTVVLPERLLGHDRPGRSQTVGQHQELRQVWLEKAENYLEQVHNNVGVFGYSMQIAIQRMKFLCSVGRFAAAFYHPDLDEANTQMQNNRPGINLHLPVRSEDVRDCVTNIENLSSSETVRSVIDGLLKLAMSCLLQLRKRTTDYITIQELKERASNINMLAGYLRNLSPDTRIEVSRLHDEILH
jgi:hypothetical protein